MTTKTTNKKIEIFQAKSGAVELSVDANKETIWATQRIMSEIFNVDVRTINEHIKNIFSSDELAKDLTIRKFRIVQREGQRERLKEILNITI